MPGNPVWNKGTKGTKETKEDILQVAPNNYPKACSPRCRRWRRHGAATRGTTEWIVPPHRSPRNPVSRDESGLSPRDTGLFGLIWMKSLSLRERSVRGLWITL